MATHLPDHDPAQTQEWLDALASVIEYEGSGRAQFILDAVNQFASRNGLSTAEGINTPYLNTITETDEAPLPADAPMMEKLLAYMRWNAVALVMRAGRKKKALGGHLSSYAAMAHLYEVGINYFFKGRDDSKNQLGDFIGFQGHSCEGIYARAFIESNPSVSHK